jgi:hypothetical protein
MRKDTIQDRSSNEGAAVLYASGCAAQSASNATAHESGHMGSNRVRWLAVSSMLLPWSHLED